MDVQVVMETNSSHDLEYSLQRRYKTLSAKKNPYSLWACWKKEGIHPFKDMKVEDLRVELTARGKSDEGNKEDLQKRLSELLGGTTRLPALLHSNETLMPQSKN